MRKNPEKRLGAGEKDAEDVKMQRFFKVVLYFLLFDYPTELFVSLEGFVVVVVLGVEVQILM